MDRDMQRQIAMGQWLFRRYVNDVRSNNLDGAVRFAEALFYLRYWCASNTLPAVWAGFETELHRLAHSEIANQETTLLLVLNI